MPYYNHNHKPQYHKPYRPAHDCSKSVISAIRRANNEWIISDSEANKMINYVTTHHFFQSPAQAIHAVIDYNVKRGGSNENTRNQIWNLLRRNTKR